jgi:2-aminoethylphosphonate-pyruvate transaminase
MSSFGAVPIDIAACHIDYLVSSSNKCIEGVPGFSFVLANKQSLLSTEGCARTLSLNLLAQWQELEQTGQFRFTPPTHAMLAFYQALMELEAEGGVEARAARYQENHDILVTGMRELGFREYLSPVNQSYIITTFHYPDSPNFSFERFYQLLNYKDFVIYPGKLGGLDCFRIGNIGRLYPDDMRALLAGIRDTLREMQVS